MTDFYHSVKVYFGSIAFTYTQHIQTWFKTPSPAKSRPRNATAMIAPAAVMMRPVLVRPLMIDCFSVYPRRRNSRIRPESMNT